MVGDCQATRPLSQLVLWSTSSSKHQQVGQQNVLKRLVAVDWPMLRGDRPALLYAGTTERETTRRLFETCEGATEFTIPDDRQTNR